MYGDSVVMGYGAIKGDRAIVWLWGGYGAIAWLWGNSVVMGQRSPAASSPEGPTRSVAVGGAHGVERGQHHPPHPLCDPGLSNGTGRDGMGRSTSPSHPVCIGSGKQRCGVGGAALKATGTTQGATGTTHSAIGTTHSATGTTQGATGTTQGATGTTQGAIGTTQSDIRTTHSAVGTTHSATGTTAGLGAAALGDPRRCHVGPRGRRAVLAAAAAGAARRCG